MQNTGKDHLSIILQRELRGDAAAEAMVDVSMRRGEEGTPWCYGLQTRAAGTGQTEDSKRSTVAHKRKQRTLLFLYAVVCVAPHWRARLGFSGALCSLSTAGSGTRIGPRRGALHTHPNTRSSRNVVVSSCLAGICHLYASMCLRAIAEQV